MGIGEHQEGDNHIGKSGRESFRRLDLESAAPEAKETDWPEHEGLQTDVASQPQRSGGGFWPPQTAEGQGGALETGPIQPPVEEQEATVSSGGETQGPEAMLSTGQNLQPFGGSAFQEYAGPGPRDTPGAPSRESEGETVAAPHSSPPLRPQALNAPSIPHLNALDPRSLAGSTWSRTEASRWAAPNVSGLLNASAPAPIRPRAEPAPRVKSTAAVLPVPDDLAARASGAWHASLGYHGLPAGTQGLPAGATDITNLALGSLPPSLEGGGAEKRGGRSPSWLSLDLQSEQEKSSPPLPRGNGSERQLAVPGDAERSSWYEQFKANIPIIASQGEHVPSSTWALVQASGLQPPSPVLPSPMKPSAQFEKRPKERKKEADLLSRMEQNESGVVQEEPAVPPVTQAAGMLFGGSYNAVVEAARSKALKEMKEITLPPLLTDAPSLRPPSKPALVIPPRALSTFLSSAQSGHEVRMDPLKPLDLSEAPPKRESPPASVSLKGWAGRSANASLDINSPGGGPRKRSHESSQSGDETRTLEVTRKKAQRGKRSESQEPNTRLTLELGSSEERGGSGELVSEGRAERTARLQSPSQRMATGVTPVSVLGDPIGSSAANTAYAAYLDSMKAGMSLSNPVRTSTPTGSSSGSAAAVTSSQTTARNASLLWRGSSDETWNSEAADVPQRRNVPLPGSLGFLRSQGGGEAAGRVAGNVPPPDVKSVAPSSGTEARSSMANLLGGYKAKLPGWPDKPMPADEYLEALQSSHFRLNAEEPTKSEAER